jgi:hypothetical protein
MKLMTNGRMAVGGKSWKMMASPKLDSQCSDSGTMLRTSDAPHLVSAAALAEINNSTADLVNGIGDA